MAKKIYVGNLPYNTDNDSLRAAFEPFGAVTSAQVIMDRETGRSRGFGFIEMAQDDEADRAISELHESELGGRKIVVNEARPRANGDRGGGGGGFGGGRGGDRGGRW